MKKSWLVIAITVLMFSGLGLNAEDKPVKSTQVKPVQPKPVAGTVVGTAAAAKSENSALPTQKDKFGYVIGLDIGNMLKKQYIDINPNTLLLGLKAALNDEKMLLTESEQKEILTELQKTVQAKQTEARNKQLEKNKKDGEEFLAKNKTTKGVVTLPSGLQYKVIAEGKGTSPAVTDTVTVNYQGTLIDGTEFDSSYKRGQPATFPVTGVIKGWTEALQLMKPNSKWELYIPPELAYGERGAGSNIGPNSTLIFNVELLSVTTGQQQP